MDEFEHYFRLCIARQCTSEETKSLVAIVSTFADIDPTDEDVVMVYHLNDDGYHCYDISLESDVTEEQGEQIIMELEELFENDDFDCEASIDSVDEQLYLNSALLEQLNKRIS